MGANLRAQARASLSRRSLSAFRDRLMRTSLSVTPVTDPSNKDRTGFFCHAVWEPGSARQLLRCLSPFGILN